MRDPIIATTLNGVLRAFESRIKKLERRQQYTPPVPPTPVTGEALLNEGTTEASPPYSFVDHTTTGMYYTGAGLGFSVDGVQAARFDGSGHLTLDGHLLYGLSTIWGGDGTAEDPSYTFQNDRDTGMYRDGSNSMAWANAGTKSMQMGVTNINWGDGTTGIAAIRHANSSNLKPTYTFVGDTNTGMFRNGTDNIGFTAGGVLALSVPSYGAYVNGGKIVFPATTVTKLQLYGSSDAYSIGVAGSTFVLKSDRYFKFYDGTTEHARLDCNGADVTWHIKSSDGYMQMRIIDTTYARHETDRGAFYFNKPIQPTYLRTYNNGTAGAPSISFRNDGNTGMYRQAENQIGFACGGSNSGYIIGTSDVRWIGAYNSTTGGTNSCQVSSIGRLQRYVSALKYKTNITPISEERRDKFFEACSGILYTSLCEDDDPDEVYVGVIADPVHEAGWKELIVYHPDDPTEVESIKYDRIVALLVDEVKAQRKLNETQSAAIAELQDAVAELKGERA